MRTSVRCAAADVGPQRVECGDLFCFFLPHNAAALIQRIRRRRGNFFFFYFLFFSFFFFITDLFLETATAEASCTELSVSALLN